MSMCCLWDRTSLSRASTHCLGFMQLFLAYLLTEVARMGQEDGNSNFLLSLSIIYISPGTPLRR